jgi:stage V sporulation protein G
MNPLEITDIRIRLSETGGAGGNLLGMAEVIFNNVFVVKEFRIIEGPKKRFVAPPTRPITDHCPRCDRTNDMRFHYCGHCGWKLKENRAERRKDNGKYDLYREVAHPITDECRMMIQKEVLRAYDEEVDREQHYEELAEREDEITERNGDV